MKNVLLQIIIILFIILNGCKSASSDPEFLAQFSGRYLYTEDETISVYSKDGILLLDWRGAKNIKPMHVDDNTFYVKDMNSKIQFLVNPSDSKEYIVFVPKEKGEKIEFKYMKVPDDYKTPSQYFTDGNYKEALQGYLNIQKKDSLNPIIDEWKINRKGYNYLQKKEYEKALEVFRINVSLYPNSANVYDSYAEALYKSGDTVNAIANYQKVLSMDSGNRNAKRQLNRLQKKEEN